MNRRQTSNASSGPARQAGDRLAEARRRPAPQRARYLAAACLPRLGSAATRLAVLAGLVQAAASLPAAPPAAAAAPPFAEPIDKAQSAYRDCIAATVGAAEPEREAEAILAAALAKCRRTEAALRRVSAQVPGETAAGTLALVLDARIAGTQAGRAPIAAR